MRQGPISLARTVGRLNPGITFIYVSGQGMDSTERSALLNDRMVPMPWEVRLSDYQVHSAMHIPHKAEAAWLTPSGRWPYWRGKLEKLDYDMPR